MIYINFEDCTGCGICLDACTVDAILLQNNKATIDQQRCTECQDCMDTCPQDAIVYLEKEPTPEKTLLVAEPKPLDRKPEQVLVAHRSFRSLILPTIGSALLWTGKELVPRLTDFALNYLNQRVLPTDQGSNNNSTSIRKQQYSMPGGGRRRRLRQRRKRNI